MSPRLGPHALALLALSCGAWPLQASAGPAKKESAKKAFDEEDPALARARELYTRGRGQFDTANYKAAIELWTEAYSILPDNPETARTKALIIYNIASAREQAFEIDRDVAHLRQARVLLQSYADAIPQLYGETAEGVEETQRVLARIASLDEAIAQAEAEATVPSPAPDEPAEPIEEPTAVDPPAGGLSPATPGPDPVARGMVAAGGTFIGLGGASLAVMIAGLVIGDAANDIDDLDPDDNDARRLQFDRGRMGNVMAIAGGVIGGAFVVGGTVLVVLGQRRGRASLYVQPSLSPTFGGLHVRGRF